MALDRETARASGLPVNRLDALLYVMVTLALVISLQAVGNILMLALLTTPATTARLITDNLATMMAFAALIGGESGESRASSVSMSRIRMTWRREV